VRRFICARCDEDADEDEQPSYCPHCGWDGLNYNDLPPEVT
jgi:Zn finger protein HypA/HybF involved in hydrogenase expression